jgi:hypothetical protein
MSKLLLSSIVFALIVVSLPERRCSCQKALEQDLPHGANETVEYGEKTVKTIRGRVTDPLGAVLPDGVVVEVFEMASADRKLSPTKIVTERERRTACVTANDGTFCFADLPSGWYLVRAGTRSSHAGMNEVYLKVKLDRRWWSRWFRSDKDIDLQLTLGT